MEPSKGRYYFFTKAKSVKLDLKVPHVEILKEAKQLRDKFIPYRENDEYKHKGWFTLPIHALGDDKPYSWVEYPEFKSGRDASGYYDWTSFSKQCPTTVEWLKTCYPSNHLTRVRFMLLESGGFISPHNDCNYYVVNPVNIAINNPNDCIWRWGDGEILRFFPGDAISMNLSYTHEVINNSSEDRYHIIVYHHDSTYEYINIMKKAFKKSHESYQLRYSTILS